MQHVELQARHAMQRPLDRRCGQEMAGAVQQQAAPGEPRRIFDPHIRQFAPVGDELFQRGDGPQRAQIRCRTDPDALIGNDELIAFILGASRIARSRTEDVELDRHRGTVGRQAGADREPSGATDQRTFDAVAHRALTGQRQIRRCQADAGAR